MQVPTTNKETSVAARLKRPGASEVASTGIACIRTGRRFIGSERDPDNYAKAQQWLDSENAQLRFT